MDIIEVEERTPELVHRLVEVWEASVRATHLFLTESEIVRIKKYVPEALCGVAHLVVANREDGTPPAFMGVQDGSLEMLFVAPDERGHGVGKALIRHGIEAYDVHTLAVNEQNPQARGFYEHMGFRVVRCTERDEQGGPYPLLYMELAD